jgi:hypothetical protein
MMRQFCALVMLALALLVQSVSAQTDKQMKLKIDAIPPNLIKSIVLEDTGEHEIAPDDQGISKVEAGDIAWATTTVAVVWNDDTTTSFPVHISMVFEGRPDPVGLHFRKDEAEQVVVAEGATIRCVNPPPSFTRDLFQMLRECRRLTKKLEETNSRVPRFPS